jgi:hypothetical protein
MKLPVARFISFLLNPLIVIVVVPFFLIYKTTGDLLTSFNWTVYTIVFLLVMAAFIFYMVRIGKFTDYDISKREQRPILFLVSLILSLFYIAGLYLFEAPSILFVVTIGVMTGIVLASIINNWIKVSMHVSTLAAMIVTLAIVFKGFYFLLLLLIPLMAYIRVKAKRHTIPETIAGAIFGSSLSILIYLVVTSFVV